MPVARVECPNCGRVLEWSAASPWRPFCSERCRLLDLGAWLTEQRAVPGEPVDAQAHDAETGRDDDGAQADPAAPR